jgi:hypothetical protein
VVIRRGMRLMQVTRVSPGHVDWRETVGSSRHRTFCLTAAASQIPRSVSRRRVLDVRGLSADALTTGDLFGVKQRAPCRRRSAKPAMIVRPRNRFAEALEAFLLQPPKVFMALIREASYQMPRWLSARGIMMGKRDERERRRSRHIAGCR